MKSGILAVCIAALAGAAPAAAGLLTPESRKGIDRILDLVTFHEPVGETVYAELAAGASLTLPFAADATVEYYINVSADADTQNVDLFAYEADGVEIDADDAHDSNPVLNIQASEHRSILDKPKGIARPITIEVRMIACEAPVCGFGLRISQVE